jgi:signal transduction histidine kinase
MKELIRTRKHVASAWHAFVVDGAVPASVRPEILRSWQRARGDLRVDPRLRICPRAAAAEDALARAESEHAHLVAARLVSHFAGRLAADGHVVAYFDRDGVMLALDGNRRTRSRLADVNFAPGACWAESAAGTNGPGTALAEAQPVEVFAAEHYVEAWQPWSCASVPVRAGGQVIGVVDITSPWLARTPSLLPTAEAIAQAIASEVEAEAARRQSAFLFQVAQDAVRARDDVLAVASHELRTPLTPLKLKLQQVQRALAGAGERAEPEALAKALRGAEGHLDRLVRFFDGLLDVSRVVREPVRPRRARVDLAAVARRGLERHRRELDRAGCSVRLDVASGVVGTWDVRLLERAFELLLDNAVKYAPGRIDVAVGAAGSTAYLHVRDHGRGIAPEDQERVFLPFERAVSACNASGFGLGLHAVRRIAEAHGGAATVRSVPGTGTTFTVELPWRSARAARDP